VIVDRALTAWSFSRGSTRFAWRTRKMTALRGRRSNPSGIRRYRRHGGERARFRVFKTLSRDGGLSWSEPQAVTEHPEADLCEPGLVRSPDGRQIALLLRENSRRFNSFVVFSSDEGETWSEPVELPATLTGDRHTARYAPDGRLFVSFRDMARGSPTWGDWVGWSEPMRTSCRDAKDCTASG
jgi:hypothetical protein